MPMPKKDLRGQVFGRWTVLREVGRANKQVLWECRCICGTIRDIPLPLAEEGNRFRMFLHKDRDTKLRTFFPGLNYKAFESRLIRNTATANWTLQDYHWRDGEE